jgi:multiple sugar transport system substrate-binding protein
MYTENRRTLLKLAAAGAIGGTSLLNAGRSAFAQDAVTIRYGWWGGSDRQQRYTEAFEAFEAENPDIQIEKEFAEYTAFQERMTTQMAARDVPDIFWIASPQVLTYEQNDLYRQLDDIETFDLSDFDDELLDQIRLNGTLNTIPNGIFVPVIRYNATFAEEDGVEFPAEDSGQWTWDGLAEFLIDYNDNNSSGRRGIAYGADADLPFEAWCRQHGEELWSEEGQVGFSVDTLAGWFEWWENLRQSGAALSISEQDGVSPSWDLVGGTVLATVQNSNHIIDNSRSFPDFTFKQQSMPIMDDAADGHRYLYFPRQTIYRGIDEGKVNAAGSILNFIINDAEFLRFTGLTMGAPINPRVRQEVREFANDAELEALDAVENDTAMEMKPRYEAPPGSNTWRTIMARTAEEIALEVSGITDASQRMIDEITTEIERAQ